MNDQEQQGTVPVLTIMGLLIGAAEAAHKLKDRISKNTDQVARTEASLLSAHIKVARTDLNEAIKDLDSIMEEAWQGGKRQENEDVFVRLSKFRNKLINGMPTK